MTAVTYGGMFSLGFASSFVTKLFAPSIAGSNGGSGGTALQKVTGAVIAGLVGGTASKIGGGKFANGARTALEQYLFNQVREFAQKSRSCSGRPCVDRQGQSLSEIYDDFRETRIEGHQKFPGEENSF